MKRRPQNDARRVYRTVDTPAPIAEAIRHAGMDPQHDHLNALLEPDPLDPGPCVCGHSFYEHHKAQTFDTGRLKWVALECDYYEYDKENKGWPHCWRYKPASGESPQRD